MNPDSAGVLRPDKDVLILSPHFGDSSSETAVSRPGGFHSVRRRTYRPYCPSLWTGPDPGTPGHSETEV